MGKLYFARHGQTVWNAENKICGATDIALTALAQFVNHNGDGESMMRLAQRIYNLLDELKAQSRDKTYLLVAYNGIARIVQSCFYDMTNEEFAYFGIGNCQVLEYEW